MSLASLQEEKNQYQEQLDIVAGQLKDDPGNAELAALKEELDSAIQLIDEGIAEIQPQQAPKTAPKQPTPPPADPPKWSRENHPAFKKAETTEDKPQAPVSYQVNDTVMAKWLGGDKAFYPAKITSITGSKNAPIYVVKFKGYDNTETVRGGDIRPMSNKRKADGPPAPAPPPPSGPGVVSSAGATVYPDAKKQVLGDDVPKPPKAKKIKAKKELEAGKNKWQEFNAKSKFGKTHKKDSMFRTPDGVNARVGFTGSGQAMRKDPSRSRHIYQVNEDLD